MTTFTVPSTFKIGFIGGGQLARMSAYQAYRYGMQTGALTSVSGGDPMEEVTPHCFRGSFYDYSTLKKLTDWADVITLENEFLDGELLEKIKKDTGTPIYPSPETFKLIENKRIEKDTFRSAGIPVAGYRIVRSPDDLKAAGASFGWPYILKSSKGGYDGYGNAMVHNHEESIKAFSALGGTSGKEIIAEERIDFTKELAVLVARNDFGTVTYPCVETIQVDHICKTVIAPAPIPRSLREQACELAVAATEAIKGTGLFAYEFFLTADNEIILNESAPRPHNSGHYTIEGCETSQFENHIRSVSGLPPGAATMRKPCAVMINLLGQENAPAELRVNDKWRQFDDVHIHVYGKKNSRTGRKMGHLTVLGVNPDDTMSTAEKMAAKIVL